MSNREEIEEMLIRLRALQWGKEQELLKLHEQLKVTKTQYDKICRDYTQVMVGYAQRYGHMALTHFLTSITEGV